MLVHIVITTNLYMVPYVTVECLAHLQMQLFIYKMSDVFVVQPLYKRQ